MKQKAVWGAIIGSLLSFTAPAASAANVVVTYTGSVQSGADGLGLFGTAGSSLVDTPYVATYVFDTDLGRVTTGSSDVSFGGYIFGSASPLVSATLKINNVIQSIAGNALADLAYFDLAGGTYYETAAVSNPFLELPGGVISYSDVVFGDYVQTPLNGTIDTTLYETSLTGGMSDAGGAAYSGFFDFAGQGGSGLTTYGKFADGGTLQVSVLPSAVPAFSTFSVPVPEPMTWMTMILGFGFIGAMMRRMSLRHQGAIA